MKLTKATNSPSLTVTRIDQARLLADPIKLRIIQEIATTPHTTKQVADMLGEKPTKLYRHVELLREAGLIELVAEKPKRGTVEKYFLAVARRFEVHPDLFAPATEEREGGSSFVNEILASSFGEIRHALSETPPQPTDEEELQPCLMKFAIRATEDDIRELRKRLLAWVQNCEDRNRHTSETAHLQWSGFAAFYPNPDE